MYIRTSPAIVNTGGHTHSVTKATHPRYTSDVHHVQYALLALSASEGEKASSACCKASWYIKRVSSVSGLVT